MRLVNYTAFKITLIFILGILFSHFSGISESTLFKGLIFSAILLILVWIRARYQLFQDVLFGLATYGVLFVLGAWLYEYKQPVNHNSHYSHSQVLTKPFLELKIKSQLKPDLYHEKYIATINAIDRKQATGDFLLLVIKDSVIDSYNVDEVLLVKTTIEEVPEVKNPYQFDYGDYLKQLGIYHQLKISSSEVLKQTRGTITLRGIAASLRNQINAQLKENGFSGNSLTLINALLLGQRRDLSPEIYADFAAAGAVHILAVSGLHVGIVMLFFQFMFKPVERFRYGKTIKVILVVLFLWGFALIAGLSPSVLRAVLMFSFLTYAMETTRETSTFNTMLASAFVLLVIDPNILFHIGFQMSYLAVFSIIWINPLLQKYYRPRFFIDRKIWETITVTTSAQIGVAVLSIYYFNHFPGLFFITNIVILPFLGIVLGSGIMMIIGSQFTSIPKLIVDGYSNLLDYKISFIKWVARQDSFYFEGLSLSIPEVIFIYLLIIAFILVFQRRTYLRIVFFLVSVVFLQTVFIFKTYQTSSQELVIFQKSRFSIFGVKNGTQLLVQTNLDSTEVFNERLLERYITKSNISQVSTDSIYNSFQYKNLRFLVIDSLGIYPTTALGTDVVVLRNSPRIHLERMLDSIQPGRIIADGSNYTSYVNRWRETCHQRKLPFHHTGKEGAVIFD
ncbi:ComEC/Rec2 family competence protein [Planktosalinus lacus]|uniref:Competence protein ComEC n=1 Tax=Planktosalinus lacus TaxID=1526573 RepID=A0A8J2V929_9FLAO|nr:ComEC/Rec2 family competence protein [Planktosalinus lacus]GGD89848.1 competence protein ComEC [Planktosalinus lacus]